MKEYYLIASLLAIFFYLIYVSTGETLEFEKMSLYQIRELVKK